MLEFHLFWKSIYLIKFIKSPISKSRLISAVYKQAETQETPTHFILIKAQRPNQNSNINNLSVVIYKNLRFKL